MVINYIVNLVSYIDFKTIQISFDSLIIVLPNKISGVKKGALFY